VRVVKRDAATRVDLVTRLVDGPGHRCAAELLSSVRVRLFTLRWRRLCTYEHASMWSEASTKWRQNMRRDAVTRVVRPARADRVETRANR
jgi:hypothetical protein